VNVLPHCFCHSPVIHGHFCPIPAHFVLQLPIPPTNVFFPFHLLPFPSSSKIFAALQIGFCAQISEANRPPPFTLLGNCFPHHHLPSIHWPPPHIFPSRKVRIRPICAASGVLRISRPPRLLLTEPPSVLLPFGPFP